MTFSLSCPCGTPLEIDERFAGREVACPECGRPVRVPRARTGPARTSGLALASLIAALVGAFTVAGTLLAALLGAAALRAIRRNPERVAGRGYAWAGVVLGVSLTGVTVLTFAFAEKLGLDYFFRAPDWAGKLNHEGPAEPHVGAWAVTRPSAEWGVLREGAAGFRPPGDTAILTLVNVREDAQAVCFAVGLNGTEDADFRRDLALQKFRDSPLIRLLGRRRGVTSQPRVRSATALARDDDRETWEVLFDITVGGHERTFLMRTHRTRGDFQVNVVAAGTRKTRFPRLEPQLRQVLESFRVGK